MENAELVVPDPTKTLSWEEICRMYPNTWVCLLDVGCNAEGWISSARVVSHDVSAEEALDEIDPPDRDTVLVHTAGRSLVRRRFETIDEDGNAISIRR